MKPLTQNHINKKTHREAIDSLISKIKIMLPSTFFCYDNDSCSVRFESPAWPTFSISINSLRGTSIEIESLPDDLVNILARVHILVKNPSSHYAPTECKMPILFNVHSTVKERFKPDLQHFQNLVTRLIMPAHARDDRARANEVYEGYLDARSNMDPFEDYNMDYKLHKEILKVTKSYITNGYCITKPVSEKATIKHINEKNITGRLRDNDIEISKLFVYRALPGVVDSDLKKFFEDVSDELSHRFLKEKHLWPIVQSS